MFVCFCLGLLLPTPNTNNFRAPTPFTTIYPPPPMIELVYWGWKGAERYTHDVGTAAVSECIVSVLLNRVRRYR